MADDNNIERLNERLESLITTMEKFVGTVSGETKRFAQLKDPIEKNKAILKSLKDTFKDVNEDLKKGRKTAKDLGSTIKAIDDQLLDLKDGMQKNHLEQQRNLLATKYLTAEYNKAGLQFAKITSGLLVNGIIKTGTGLVNNLQGTTSGMQMAAGLMEGVIDVTSSTIQAGTKVVAGMGEIGASLARTGKGRAIGLGIGLAAEGLGFLTEKSSELAKFGINVLAKEVDKTVTAFHTISSTGATFADGMTGMRTAAHNSGLTLDTFANVIKNNQATLHQTGLGMGEAARRIGGISKELRYGAASQLGVQLQNLGYGFEEQTAIVAQYTANLNAAGALRGKSDAELAGLSAEYAKDLKKLQAITGENAQQAADQARIAGMQSDIMARLSPEEGLKFQAALRSLPKDAHIGFMEFVSSGGTAIAHGATNMMMQQSPKFEAMIKDSFRGVYDASKSASQVSEETLRMRALVGEELRERLRVEGDQIGMANRLLGGMGGVGQGFVDLRNGLILATQTNAERTKAESDTVDEAAKTKDAFTKIVTEAEATANALKISFENNLTGPNGAITKFASVANAMLTGLEDAMRAAGFDVNGTGKSSDSRIWDALKHIGVSTGVGTAGGAAIGAITGGGVGAVPGAISGGIYGLGTSLLDVYQGEYADGGVAKGPVSGYSATLHGTEAVVPLPDNKSIPVSLDGSSLTAAVHQQSSILSEILRAMQNNNSLTSQIVQNSY